MGAAHLRDQEAHQVAQQLNLGDVWRSRFLAARYGVDPQGASEKMGGLVQAIQQNPGQVFEQNRQEAQTRKKAKMTKTPLGMGQPVKPMRTYG